MSVRRRTGAALALIVAIAAVIGIVLAVDSPSSTSGASTQPQVPGAATVQRRNLVETDTESGTVSYANPQTVYDRLSGTITWLPSVGQEVKPGQALFRVNGCPVILMNGSTPAYRDLSAADSDGPDILELNRNLVALGYNPAGIVVDDVWQAATTAAVEVFQESLGESPTGVLTLGQVVFLPGDQLISAVNTTLGSDGAASSASDTSPTEGSPEFVSLTTTTPTTTTPGSRPGHKKHAGSQSTQTLAALIALLKAESAQLKAESAQLRAAESRASSSGQPSKQNNSGSAPSKSGSGSSKSGGGSSSSGGSDSSGTAGGGGGSASPILQTTSTQLIVTVDLDTSKQSEANVGEKVMVEMPAGNTVNGTVTAVSPVAQSSSGSGNGNGNNGGSGSGNGGGGNGGSSGATIPVTVTLSGHVSGAGLDQAAVSVNFAQAQANHVLSVPVTALLATSGGGYAVQEAAAPHKLLPVTTGLFAAGYVQISGPGIYPGLEVTDSQG